MPRHYTSKTAPMAREYPPPTHTRTQRKTNSKKKHTPFQLASLDWSIQTSVSDNQRDKIENKKKRTSILIMLGGMRTVQQYKHFMYNANKGKRKLTELTQ